MKRIVYVAAEVIEHNEKALTVRLLNGFGNPEETVHADHAFPAPVYAEGGVISKAPGLSGCCGARV